MLKSLLKRILVCRRCENTTSNNHMHSDSKKRRSFLALLFAAGDVRRYSAVSLSISGQYKVAFQHPSSI